jgi:cystathionine beta-lyase
MSDDDTSGAGHRPATRVVHEGRDPAATHGFVNPPVYRGSTVLFDSVARLQSGDQPFTYGRRGTPTVKYLEQAITDLEGGAATALAPSGLAAISTALFAFVEAGDHILMTDSVYQPTRRLCDRVLARLGIETTYYDPCDTAGLARLVRPRTRLVFTESPGSQTFEMQDIPAISEFARAHGLWHVMDNTWATPLYFRPLDHGVDVVVHALTKYVVGHADAMLGSLTANERASRHVLAAKDALGVCPGSEETYLALRGLRTLDVRLERHQSGAIRIARWLAARPEVARVLHPALEGHPGHAIWKRDYTGASGLFSIVLKPVSQQAVAAMLDGLSLFGMGYSWGGYESLVLPFDPAGYRTATQWRAEGPALRLHIGLEAVEDLEADLAAGFARLAAHT